MGKKGQIFLSTVTTMYLKLIYVGEIMEIENHH